MLEGKYKCSPGARSVEPSRLPPPGSLTLSALKLTDEAAFDEIFKRIEQEINGLDAAARGSVAPVTYAAWFRGTDPALRAHLKIARDAKMFAFQKPSREARTAAFGAIGGDIMGLLIELQLMKLYVNILLYEDWSRSALPMGTNANARAAWEDDPAIKRLMKAAGRGVRQEIEAALPEGIKRFDYHNAWVDKQIIAVEHNASLAKQVVQYLDIVMIAISIIEVIRAPVLKPSDVAGPPTITGLLPGGVAIGSRFAATDVSSVLASIQKLIEIGALDKGVIGTVGLLSGSGSVSLPQFQRPTGLSMSSPVKPPVQPTGQSSGKPASKASSGLGSKSSSGPSTQTTKPRGGAPGTRPSEPFTKAGKEEVWNRNAVKHGGTNKCDNCGVDAVRPQQHTRGVKPPGNEGHVDHATARSKGGSGTPDNGQVLCRECNLEKGNK